MKRSSRRITFLDWQSKLLSDSILKWERWTIRRTVSSAATIVYKRQNEHDYGISESRGAVWEKLSRLPRASCGLHLERGLYPGDTYTGHDGAAREFSVASPINNARTIETLL